jgi:quercetin dioxygenase-like cupin family protein
MEIINEERGRIIPVAEGNFKTVLIIESKQGAVRANHYHKTDAHVMYILSGKARYVEAAIGEPGKLTKDRIVGPGETILTPPLVAHAMEFLEDSAMIVCTRNERDYDTYMADIVKVKLI